MSRARVSQLLRLLSLAPRIIADLECPDRTGLVPSELLMRRIASIPDTGQQWSRYRCLVENRRQAKPPLPKEAQPLAAPSRHRGFQWDLERARALQLAWDSGKYASLIELGHQEGITGTRVSQILCLLQLAPEIIAVLDVPAEQCPSGIAKKDIRALTQIRDHEEQLAIFRKKWPGVLDLAAK